jgi:hypothetical protein
VVEGVISWDDVHLFAYRDDPYQNGSGTTDAQEEVIEDRHVWSYYNNGRVNIGNGDEALRFVSATSPIIPEPATLTLLTAGLCCLGLRQARPRRR